MNIPISSIRPSPNPIRKTWDEDKMNELAASIAERGVIVPVKVRPNGSGYEIVYGHRRIEAARRAGLVEVPAIVEATDDTETLVQALIENVQREDMTAYDKGAAVMELQRVTGWPYAEMERLGIASTVSIKSWVEYRRERDMGVMILTPQGEAIAQTVEIKRALGDDLDAKRKVAAKVGDEELTWRETRAVADAYKAADTPELKDAVLNTSGKLGDPDRILQVARMSVGADGLVARHEEERRQSFQEYDKAAKDFFDFMKLSRQMVKTARSAAGYGKFSPEAAEFAVRRIDDLIGELEALREVLSHVD